MIRLPCRRASWALLPLLLVPAAGTAADVTVATVTVEIDRLIDAQLSELGIPPAPPCDDATFLRRAFLDAIGTLPTAAEARAFLAERDPGRHARLVDRLLEREEFSEFLALRWGDILRIKAEFPSRLWPYGAAAFHRWVRDRYRDHTPFDRFATELITASGSCFRDPAVNFYRACAGRRPSDYAAAVAVVFLGVRLDRAGLDADRLAGWTAGFARIGSKPTDEWKEEIIFFDRLAPAPTAPPMTLDGRPLAVPAGTDPRRAVAAWVTAPDNPWFARALANRVWAWSTGRGIVHETDDLRPDNPPWNAALLDLLAAEARRGGYEPRHLFRLVLNSSAYRRAARDGETGAPGFSHYRLRRLEAEPLLDAINQVTGGTERYVSAIPEPFTILPRDQRAIGLADGSIELPFLTIFGRPPRNTAFESERDEDLSVEQSQHLLASSHLQDKLDRCFGLKRLVIQKPALADAAAHHAHIVAELYLHILSRHPTDDERQTALAYLGAPARTLQESAADLAWALINSSEFILKH